jgi:peptide chain release factor 2
MKILRARLYEREMKEQAEKLEELHSTKKEIAWGSQIRSYVMHPYKMVKDHRTNRVIHDVDRVMNGEINDFMEAYLAVPRNRSIQLSCILRSPTE